MTIRAVEEAIQQVRKQVKDFPWKITATGKWKPDTH